MRRGKKPTFEQKKLLSDTNRDWTEWLFVKKDGNSYMFKNKTTDEIVVIEKK